MILALENISLSFGAQPVLDGVSLSLGAGEVIALLGPSGSGKTSLLRIALGFVAPKAGRVMIADEEVSRAGTIVVPPEERNLAVVFQDLALWPHLTVRGNLEFGLRAKKVAPDERRARVDEALAWVGLSEKAERHPGALSGGERQRVAISRALVLRPRAILLDEPLANLDVALKRELLAMFRELFKERGTPALFVTHDLDEAVALGDRIAVIEKGTIVQQGSVDDLRRNPATDFIRILVEK